MQVFVSAIFSDEEAASEAVRALVDASFRPDSISACLIDAGRREQVPIEHRTAVPTGSVAGGVLGATLGAVGTGLVATGALAAPGTALLAAGPIAAALQGAAAGAAAGGLVGALAGLGYWKVEAEFPEEELSKGFILVGAETPTRVAEAEQALRGAGGWRVTSIPVERDVA